MLTRMKTASLQGVNGYPVTVETDLHRGAGVSDRGTCGYDYKRSI